MSTVRRVTVKNCVIISPLAARPRAAYDILLGMAPNSCLNNELCSRIPEVLYFTFVITPAAVDKKCTKKINRDCCQTIPVFDKWFSL